MYNEQNRKKAERKAYTILFLQTCLNDIFSVGMSIQLFNNACSRNPAS